MPFLWIRGDKNDGCRVTGSLQALLQVETTQARHLQIGYQAGRGFDAAGIHKLLHGRECKGPVPQRQHKVLDALPRPGIVIDDRNQRGFRQFAVSQWPADRLTSLK